MIAKYTIFDRGFRSSFETYRQEFYTFAKLAVDFIKIIFAKIQLVFDLFLRNRDSFKVCNNGKCYTYVTITER